MIKKLLSLVLVVALLSLTTPAYAGATSGAKLVFDKLVIDDTDKHWSTNTIHESSASGEFFIGDKSKVGLMVEVYQQVATPTSFQVEVEVNVARASGGTWAYVDVVRNNAGDDSPDLALTYPTDGTSNWLLAYLPMDLPAQYVSVEVVGTGTDADNRYVVDMWVTWQADR